MGVHRLGAHLKSLLCQLGDIKKVIIYFLGFPPTLTPALLGCLGKMVSQITLGFVLCNDNASIVLTIVLLALTI